MPKTIHYSVDLDFLRDQTMKGITVLVHPVTEQPLSETEVYELIRIEKESGHVVYCPCDNRTTTGHCAGHYER